MTKDEEMILREFAGGRCAIQSVIDALGPVSLWSKDGLEREINKAVQAEREQIAQMIEDAPTLVDFAQNEHGGCLMCGFTPKLAAASIRARGQHGD